MIVSRLADQQLPLASHEHTQACRKADTQADSRKSPRAHTHCSYRQSAGPPDRTPCPVTSVRVAASSERKLRVPQIAGIAGSSVFAEIRRSVYMYIIPAGELSRVNRARVVGPNLCMCTGPSALVRPLLLSLGGLSPPRPGSLPPCPCSPLLALNSHRKSIRSSP